MGSSRSVLRGLPAVETLLQHPTLLAAIASLPRALVVEFARAALTAERARLAAGGNHAESVDGLALAIATAAHAAHAPALRRVINATGVVLHTNLGRAPLGAHARAAVADVASGYSTLEYDLAAGKRGDRGVGVERWLKRLTGAEAAAIVNNGAAALLLALAGVASGRKVVVSRGELVEIGGSFRVPEIMEKSGATLLEVGATNRTHLRDFERAFDRHADIGAVLRVHPSNFRIEGFTARPELRELAALARRNRVPLIEDLGSGALVDLARFGLEHEPTVGESLAAGVSIVTFSGDKLLGGSQAGLLLGTRRWIDRVRKDPLARALRADKLALAALEATLPLYADPERAQAEIPVLAMLLAHPEVLEARAREVAAALERAVPGLETRVVKCTGEVGGGALPRARLSGWAVELSLPDRSANQLERGARGGNPPVIGTIRAGAFRIDLRTVLPAEHAELVEALRVAFGAIAAA